ncbi:MAG TPA: hypothetical protein VLK28_04470 [Methylomirabilota bacterium]|jgi:hypothetical protein|nr:hypothetical protein [Methylomirabilota bacterium]
MNTTEKQGQQPGHDRDKDRQGQSQQEPGRNPQPGQDDRSGRQGGQERNR